MHSGFRALRGRKLRGGGHTVYRFWNVVHTCCCCFVLGAFRKCPCRLNVEIVTPPSQNTQNLPLPLARTQDKEVFPSNIAEQTREAHKKPYVSSSSSVAFYEMQD